MRVDPHGSRHAPAVQVSLEPSALTPLIAAVVEATLLRVEEARSALPEKIAFSEPEAARLLSLHPHQLRDARLRGEIEASVGPGRKILYSRADLLAYLARRRWSRDGTAAAG